MRCIKLHSFRVLLSRSSIQVNCSHFPCNVCRVSWVLWAYALSSFCYGNQWIFSNEEISTDVLHIIRKDTLAKMSSKWYRKCMHIFRYVAGMFKFSRKKSNEWILNKQKSERETRNYSITIWVFTTLSMLFYIMCIQNINHFHSKYTWFFFHFYYKFVFRFVWTHGSFQFVKREQMKEGKERQSFEDSFVDDLVLVRNRI